MLKPLIYAVIAALFVVQTANVPQVAAKTQVTLHSIAAQN